MGRYETAIENKATRASWLQGGNARVDALHELRDVFLLLVQLRREGVDGSLDRVGDRGRLRRRRTSMRKLYRRG